jgi:hypothetical protein
VLRGYLEGDGYWEIDNQRWRLGFTQNDALAADLRTICARLGYQLRLRRHNHQLAGEQYPGWRGEIRCKPSEYLNAKPNGEVIAIGESRARKFWDISVEDEPHLFALASGVLTHNCKRAPMPESVTDRPTSATEKVFLLAKSARYFFDMESVKEEGEGYGRSNWNAQQFKGGDLTINHGGKGDHGRGGGTSTFEGGRNMRNFWLLGPEPFPEAHVATFPPEIPRRAILAGTSEKGVCPQCGAPWERVTETTYERVGNSDRGYLGHTREADPRDTRENALPKMSKNVQTLGWFPTCSCNVGDSIPATVLDPFFGAGTTGFVADRLGRNCIGIELNEKYSRMAADRVHANRGFVWSGAVEIEPP